MVSVGLSEALTPVLPMDDDDPLCSVRFLRITNILLAGRVMSNLVAEMQLWQATSVGDHALVKILMRENPNKPSEFNTTRSSVPVSKVTQRWLPCC